ANRIRSVGPRGAVFVRPTSLEVVPVLNRYQYHRFGSRPLTSTCTECPYSGCAMMRPLRTTRFMFSSEALCQSQETDYICRSCCPGVSVAPEPRPKNNSMGGRVTGSHAS